MKNEPSSHPSTRRTAAAAIAAGVLLFVSVFAEILVSGEDDGKITNLPLASLYIAGFGAGVAALFVALRGLRALTSDANPGRAGRVGSRLALAGAALLVVFAGQALVTVLVTGDSPGGFALFGLGFLLLVAGQLMAGSGMVRAGVRRRPGQLLLLASVAAVTAVAVPADPFHDLGLFGFDAAWIGVGVALLRPARSSARGRRILRLSAGVGVIFALTTASASAGGATTEHFAGTLTAASVNPCSLASGTLDVTFKGVSHTSTSTDGGLHHTATVTGTTTFTPDDPTQPSYTGKFSAWDGQNGSEGATITSTAAFHDIFVGSDGSRVRDQGLFHITVLADGTVTAALERFTLTCP